MKKLLPPLFLLISINSFAGWEMMFCDSVDDKGNCKNKSEMFSLSNNEARLNVALTNAEGLHTTKIYFEIYFVDPATFAEELVGTQEINTQANAQSASCSIRLSKKGSYLIKARDSYKDYITSRELAVK